MHVYNQRGHTGGWIVFLASLVPVSACALDSFGSEPPFTATPNGIGGHGGSVGSDSGGFESAADALNEDSPANGGTHGTDSASEEASDAANDPAGDLADSALDTSDGVADTEVDAGLKDAINETEVKPGDVGSDMADAAQDTDAGEGAVDATAEQPKPNCQNVGVRIRFVASSGKTVVQANGAVGDPNNFQTGVCQAGDDLDPAPSVFECCLATGAVGKNTNFYFDFVFGDNTHACTNTAQGCAPYSQYSAWGNGVPVEAISVTYLPSCKNIGCPWVLIATVP